MTDALLGWLLRAVLLGFGAWALLALGRWLRQARGDRREAWATRIALAMLGLAAVYAIGHARLLVEREQIEENRMRYARFGDPRLAETNRAETRGWILDCTGQEQQALARYALRDGETERAYPLGEVGANLVGGGRNAGERDYTVERLFAEQLRKPRSILEWGEPHPAGADLRLTLCAAPTRRAWELLRDAGRPGAVVAQEVNTGAVVAYAATGSPEQAPLGIKRYAPPGSVWKLALAALWWDSGGGDPPIPCPSEIRVTPRATIRNSGGRELGTVGGPEGVLVPSCNTGAVWMAQRLRERIGADAVAAGYRRLGFHPYVKDAPSGNEAEFWNTGSAAWARRMSPPPSRLRIGEGTGPAEWAQLAIGQGPVDVTPIGVSRFVQAIGNDGVMLPPTLERERAEDAPEGVRVMKPETARKLQRAMRETVRRGTARSVLPLLEGVPGSLGGKTGTAQVRGAPDDGWFAGLVFDARGRPRYSVVVYLRGGGPGGDAPARIAARLAPFLLAGEGE